MPPSSITIAGAAFAGLSLTFFLIKLFKKRNLVRLQGKVVVITGASSGLGEACAKLFYQAGAKVILCSRKLDQLENVKKGIVQSKCITGVELFEPVCMSVDLSDLASLSGFVESVLAVHGQIDVLINNAGISYRGDVASTDLAVHQQLMTVNYFGQVELTKAILPHMTARQSGHIVAISSLQGRISIPFRSAYSASKHALQAYFDCLRAEVSGQGVSVSVVSPAYINTNLSRNALTADGTQYGVMDSTTAAGMSASYVAGRVLSCVQSGESELILSPMLYRLVVLIRTVCPTLYFHIMSRRGRTQWASMDKQK